MKPTKEMIEALILTSSTAAGGTEDCVSAGLTAALAAMPGPEEIVPQHCSGYSFVFEPGVLHVRKNGSGYIVVNEDDFILEDDRYEGEHGPEGSVHWIAKLDASEIVALRDFLNGVPTTPAPDLAAENESLRAALDDRKTPTVWTVEFATPEDDEEDTASFAFSDKEEFEKFLSVMHDRVISIFERSCVTADEAKAALERT